MDDKYGSPTFSFDFAENILPLVATGRYGLYHMANRGVASRYQIACEIIRILDLEGEVRVFPVNSAQYPLPAPRGRSEGLINYKLNVLGLNHMPPWEDSLRKYLKEYETRNGG